MVRPCLTVENQSKVLRWLATEIINAIQPEETVEDLLANPCLLHSYMLKTPVNWHWIANEVGVDEKKVSRWYYETHLRHILTIKMTSEDRGEIRKIIINWIRCKQVPDERLYQLIHERFGEKYSRQELRMTYYNMLNSRCIRAVLSECNIQRPTRRRKLSEGGRSDFSSPVVLHIPGYSPNSQLSSLDNKKSLHPAPQKMQNTAPACSSGAVPTVENGSTSAVSDEPITFSPLVIQNAASHNSHIKLLNLQTFPIVVDNTQFACIPLIIIEPEANTWSVTLSADQVGSTG